jgi:hypothetical protein
MPHAHADGQVQAYSLVDPAPTYGAANFSATLDFVSLMLHTHHDVVYYPESACAPHPSANAPRVRLRAKPSPA